MKRFFGYLLLSLPFIGIITAVTIYEFQKSEKAGWYMLMALGIIVAAVLSVSFGAKLLGEE